MKTCTVCGKDKPLEDYYNLKASKDGKAYRCKPCDNNARLEYDRKHRERRLLNQRKASIRCKYGLSLEDLELLIKEQDNRCKICSIEMTQDTSKTTRCIDHCHQTGKVRGLLCANCNKALGMFNDNMGSLENAINYLKENTNADIH